jgi:CheY-like chemotaxis protein
MKRPGELRPGSRFRLDNRQLDLGAAVSKFVLARQEGTPTGRGLQGRLPSGLYDKDKHIRSNLPKALPNAVTVQGMGSQDGGTPPKSGDRRTRIMLVDDDQEITKILKRILEREGFTVDAFNNPTLALLRFETGKYDLVITDIRMPEMGGFDLYRGMKKIESDVRVCFLTSFDTYESEFKRLFPKTPVVGLLRKPIAIDTLIKEIEAMIRVS